MKQKPPRHGRMEQQLGRRYAKEIADRGNTGLYRDCPEDIENSLKALEWLNKVGLQMGNRRINLNQQGLQKA